MRGAQAGSLRSPGPQVQREDYARVGVVFPRATSTEVALVYLAEVCVADRNTASSAASSR